MTMAWPALAGSGSEVISEISLLIFSVQEGPVVIVTYWVCLSTHGDALAHMDSQCCSKCI